MIYFELLQIFCHRRRRWASILTHSEQAVVTKGGTSPNSLVGCFYKKVFPGDRINYIKGHARHKKHKPFVARGRKQSHHQYLVAFEEEKNFTYLLRICNWPGEFARTGCDWRLFALRMSTHLGLIDRQTEKQFVKLLCLFFCIIYLPYPGREFLCPKPKCHWKRLGRTCT